MISRTSTNQLSSAKASPGITQPPLCVDLDGTLCRTDILTESCLQWLLRSPFNLILILRALFKGRAYLKERLAQENLINETVLPYNGPIVEWLKEERSSGRRLVLATGTNRAIAEKIANHVGCFDMVIGSDATRNLKGAAKAEELKKRFPHSGFDYIGDSAADIPVWKQAQCAFGINPPGRFLRAVPKLSAVSITRPSLLISLLTACRPHQWAKNVLLFVPIIAAHRILDLRADLSVTISFVAFSLVASSAYLTNDIIDLQNDRSHPSKKARPIASGDLQIGTAMVASILLLTLGLGIALSTSALFFLCLLAYYSITLAYSYYFKQRLMMDVICLALLYSARVFTGGVSVHIVPSHWLVIFSMFVFTSLALVKRYTEIYTICKTDSYHTGRAYCLTDLPIISILGVSSGVLSTLILVLYVTSPEVQVLYRFPQMLLLACPILLYWFGRLWILTGRDEIHHDPIVWALSDFRSYVVAFLIAAVLFFATIL
jgi:4-hydroxybenzoate polyprenyltransferase/phosphoserine phosphatase